MGLSTQAEFTSQRPDAYTTITDDNDSKVIHQGPNMQAIDKHGLIQSLKSRPRVVVEIGCGEKKVHPDAIGIDIVDGDNVDIVADVSLGLGFLPDECVDELHAYHVIEHLPDTALIMAEVHRVLKKGGQFIGAVPHFSNPYYFSDHTHKTFFGLYSFSYFTKTQPFRRKVPGHYTELDFKIRKVKLLFWSPFLLINIFNQIFNVLFNASLMMKEIYEAIFSNMIPAFELQFILEK